jgi:hypothetical protein
MSKSGRHLAVGAKYATSGIPRPLNPKKRLPVLKRLIFAALAFTAAASGALAAQATLGGVSISLPSPPGFCDLTTGNNSDNRMITIVSGLLEKSGNKLLSMSADCRQLSDWRVAKRQLLDDYAQYQTTIAGMQQPPPEPIAQTCTTLRDEGNKIVENQMPDLKARVESAIKNVKMGAASFVGVLAEDATACYAGLIQQIKTEAGTDKVQLSVFAVTHVKNRLIFVYRFAVYHGSGSVDATLSKLKSNVAALTAANR